MKLFVSSICLVAACGGSDLDPGSGDDPGGGTSTLVVDGRVSAEARFVNARTPAEFDTEFSVEVTLNGAIVTTGSVTITSSTGTVDLLFSTQDTEGRWRGSAPGYDEVYVLDVVSGPDYVEGVRVDGPAIHVFDAPLAGAIVDSTMPLEVAWSSGDQADSAAVRPEPTDWISIPDSGDYLLAAGSLEADPEQARENTIELNRENRVIPAGAAAGSEWTVRIRNEIQVVAQPNPAL
jgi:hypothetical protein